MRSGSRAAVEEAVNATSWVHQLAGLESPGQEPLVKMVVVGLQRELAKPKKRKEPVTLDILKRMIDSAGSNPTLSECRLLAIVFLAFSAFLRFDEISKVRCCDIQFHQEHMTVKILSSKTDQYREGDEVVVSRGGSDLCPVRRLEEYYRLAEIDCQSMKALFHGIVNTKNGEKLRESGALSYTRMREIFLAKLHSLGFDSAMYGVHSLRSGGATLAASSGIPDRMFKRHGRWRSETAKDGYVKDTLEARLSVTKGMEL
jgi:integrase